MTLGWRYCAKTAHVSSSLTPLALQTYCWHVRGQRDRPIAVITDPLHLWRIGLVSVRVGRGADTYDMVRVTLGGTRSPRPLRWHGAATCRATCSKFSSTRPTQAFPTTNSLSPANC